MRLIDLDDDRHCYVGNDGEYERWNIDPDVPTIDPVKHGRWVKRTDENCWWYECSECGDYPMKNVYGHEELSAYCAHCGAKMEGEEDKEC